MSADFSRLRHEHQTDQEQAQIQGEQTDASARQFNSVEDLLRHDAHQNPVPPQIGERLNESLKSEPPLKTDRPWYKRLFGG